MSAIERRDCPGVVAICQHHIRRIRRANVLITVFLDDRGHLLEVVGHTERRQFPCATGELSQHLEFRFGTGAGSDEIVEFCDHVRRDD